MAKLFYTAFLFLIATGVVETVWPELLPEKVVSVLYIIGALALLGTFFIGIWRDEFPYAETDPNKPGYIQKDAYSRRGNFGADGPPLSEYAKYYGKYYPKFLERMPIVLSLGVLINVGYTYWAFYKNFGMEMLYGLVIINYLIYLFYRFAILQVPKVDDTEYDEYIEGKIDPYKCQIIEMPTKNTPPYKEL